MVRNIKHSNPCKMDITEFNIKLSMMQLNLFFHYFFSPNIPAKVVLRSFIVSSPSRSSSPSPWSKKGSEQDTQQDSAHYPAIYISISLDSYLSIFFQKWVLFSPVSNFSDSGGCVWALGHCAWLSLGICNSWHENLINTLGHYHALNNAMWRNDVEKLETYPLTSLWEPKIIKLF